MVNIYLVRWSVRFLVLAIASSSVCIADSEKLSESEVLKFFSYWVELSNQFDLRAVDYYANDAVIESLRRYPFGETKNIRFTVAELKALLADGSVIERGKSLGDTQRFTNISVTVDGDMAIIKADRYSDMKCYWDYGYYMIVECSKGGNFLITKEYSESQPQFECE